MDKFGVPKKVNRHVLKALFYKKELGHENTGFSEIFDLVEDSMKNTVPVRDLPSAVRESLQNMTTLGVISKKGSKFFIRNIKSKTLTPKRVNPKLFGINDRREEKSILDPNLKRFHGSDESLTGSDRSRVLKRFRPVKEVIRRGHSVVLPKARRTPRIMNLNTDYEQEGSPNDEIYNNEEEVDMDERRSSCSLNTPLKIQSFTQISEMDQSLQQKDQNSKNEPDTEEKKCIDVKDRPLMPKPESTSKEDLTIEQKTDTVPEQSTQCSNDSQYSNFNK